MGEGAVVFRLELRGLWRGVRLGCMLKGIRRILMTAAGGLGGVVVGGLLSLILLHLKTAHAVPMGELGGRIFWVVLISTVAGILWPRFFMMYFFCPVSWFFQADDSGGGFSAGGEDGSFADFLFPASYLIGLVLLVFGVVFSGPWVVGFGVLGILVFSMGWLRACWRGQGGDGG